MNQDLFLSILAMDSYNRGYDQGTLIGSGDSTSNQNEIGRQIGYATITAQDISSAAKAVGFYALSYEWNGQTVISYRGTNQITVPVY